MTSLLRSLWAGWKRLAHALGVVNRTILLSVFYWVIIDLINLGLRLGRADLLDRRMRPAATYWRPKPPHSGTYQQQF